MAQLFEFLLQKWQQGLSGSLQIYREVIMPALLEAAEAPTKARPHPQTPPASS